MAINYHKIRNGITLKPTAQPTTPENGDIYYDSTANLFEFYQNGAYVTIPLSVITSANYRAGSSTIASSATTKAVTFSSALASTSYGVVATMLNTTDTNPQFIPVTITATATTGFTATWNLPTDTANYVLNWIVFLNN